MIMMRQFELDAHVCVKKKGNDLIVGVIVERLYECTENVVF